MIKISRYWKEVKRPCMGNLEDCYFIGKWKIGWITRFWDTSSKDAPYGAMLTLPGMASCQGHFSSEALAKKRIEEVTLYWLEHLDHDLRTTSEVAPPETVSTWPVIDVPVARAVLKPKKMLVKRPVGGL